MPLTRRAGARLLAILIVLTLAPGAQAQMLGDIVDVDARLTPLGTEIVGKRAVSTLVSAPVFAPFSGVAVEIHSADPSLQADVRFRRRDSWTPWREMHLVRSAVGDGLVAGYREDDAIDAGHFEVRVSTNDGSRAVVRGGGVFDTRTDAEGVLPAPGVYPEPALTSGTIVPPPLITRDEWGAQPFIRGDPVPLAQPTHDYMTFHHAAGYSADTREEGVQQLQAIQDLHQNVRGWSDIGYHFVIDRGGNLYQGRPFLNDAASLSDLPVFARGAHAGGANTGNIGICLLGCYHPPEGGHCAQEITEEALETYVTLFAFLSERYGVPPARIAGHRDFGSTACPGDNNYALLPEIRTRVATLLETGNAAIAEVTLQATAGSDGVVRVTWQFVADFGVNTWRLERWLDGHRTVLAEGADAVPNAFSDPGIETTDPVSYRLYVTDAAGREQRAASVDVQLESPSAPVLSEAFPNPASGQVGLRYFLRSRGHVTLNVFDSAGRRVADLVDAIQEGDSWYAVPFEVASLPAGVYYYRVQIQGFSGIAFEETRPLVVLR